MRAAIALSLATFAASTAAAQPSTQPAAEPEVVQYGGALVIFDLIGIGADWAIVSRVKRPTSAYTPTVTPVRDGGMTFGVAGTF